MEIEYYTNNYCIEQNALSTQQSTFWKPKGGSKTLVCNCQNRLLEKLMFAFSLDGEFNVRRRLNLNT